MTQTGLAGALLIEPRVFGDDRGFFMESYNRRDFNEAIGSTVDFVQDNHSRSTQNVLRGLHYQIAQPQGKLVRVLSGRVFDAIVDIRRSSPTFGRWFGCVLDANCHHMLWVPEGFAHGFLVLSDSADVLYKTTDYYAPQAERAIAWNDPDIGLEWPMTTRPKLSGKDSAAGALADAELFD